MRELCLDLAQSQIEATGRALTSIATFLLLHAAFPPTTSKASLNPQQHMSILSTLCAIARADAYFPPPRLWT